MKLYPFIRGGIMNISKENYCPVCSKKFVLKVENRFGVNTPILIVNCSHSKQIYNYLFEERGNE